MGTTTIERPQQTSMADHIAATVAKAPPLTDETMARVLALFTAGQ